MAVEAAFSKAGSFLAPVLSRGNLFVKAKGQSIIQCLDPGDITAAAGRGESGLRFSIIEKALRLLLDIHEQLSQNGTSFGAADKLHNTHHQKILDGLLDLISLEGIYPHLSPGVGIPIEKRVKSVLHGGLVTRPSPAADVVSWQEGKALLSQICRQLYRILNSNGTGLGPSVQERTLVDVIAGWSELACAPRSQDEQAKDDGRMLRSLLDGTPTPLLFPALTCLLQPSTPDWFRAPISKYLSFLPLRPEGVRHTVNFIATSVPQDPHTHSSGTRNKSSGPSLSLEVLSHSSKLLSSVPSSMTAEEYFAAISPQLLELLDDTHPDNPRAAAYIIGNGILGRRKFGSPGGVGWKVFAEPILQGLNPISAKQGAARADGLLPLLVSETSLAFSVGRLASLVLLHPNPGLTKRLVSPCLRPLWSLCCFSKDLKRLHLFSKIFAILCTYFKTSVGIEKLMTLSDNLLWDGEEFWMYGPGPTGGVEIRQRSKDAQSMNVVGMMEILDCRVDEFLELLQSVDGEEDDIGSLFVYVSKRCLVGEEASDGSNRLDAIDDERKDPLQSLVYAKLTQKMLEKYKSKLAANPKRIVELVNQLLTGYVMEYEGTQARRLGVSTPSFAGLRAIVDLSPQSNGGALSTEHSQQREDSVEMISISLSLLTDILSSPEFSLDPETFALFGSLRKNLTKLTSPAMSLPISTNITASNILSLIDFHISAPTSNLPADKGLKPLDPYAADRKLHLQSLSYLADPLPPIRAQGLSQLTTLITKPSPILDISSTTILLQSVLQDEDEFIYLSAIKALGSLAFRHPRTVVRRLVESYIDVTEDVQLDVRIKTGEALLKTVESLGGALVGDTASLVGESMIAVAGRRSKKPKAAQTRQENDQKAQALKKEADEAWGGEAPDFEPDQQHLEDERLLRSWTSPNPNAPEDDIRIRTSALSILSAAIETNILGLGAKLVSESIDLVLSLIMLEIAPEVAILRRAALLVIASVVKVLINDKEKGEEGLGWNLGGGWEEVKRVLHIAERRELDQVVSGHIRGVLEGLDEWQRRVLVGNAGGGEIRFGLDEGEVRGLAVNPRPLDGKKPAIEEVE